MFILTTDSTFPCWTFFPFISCHMRTLDYKSTWTNCLNISMHSCEVFTSLFTDWKLRRGGSTNTVAFMWFIYISWMENKKERKKKTTKIWAAHPTVIPNTRTRRRICARWNKRCSTVYLLLLEIKNKKKWGDYSILLWTTSLTGATALRNKDTPSPPPFFLSQLLCLYCTPASEYRRLGKVNLQC